MVSWLRNRLFQENHARDCQEIEELQSICCEEADKREVMNYLGNKRGIPQPWQMMAQIRELQNKVNSLSDLFFVLETICTGKRILRSWIREQLWRDPCSWSNFCDSEFQDLATLRFRSAGQYTELYGYYGERFWTTTCSKKDYPLRYWTIQRIWHLPLRYWDLMLQEQQGEKERWKENRLNHLTSKVELKCWIILVELFLRWCDRLSEHSHYGMVSWKNSWLYGISKAGKSTSELRFVYELPILWSPCSGQRSWDS